ncbi:MAG: hypothetical protein IJ795_04485 [Bacteroidales bacterium]|nr:hypothetical protein [Bacteroidales bacterium]
MKNILAYAAIVLLFLVLSYGFVPWVLEGKIVDQSDISGYVGMARETNLWNEAHPSDRTAWTNSMFGGMPTTMLTGNTEGDWTKPVYDLFLTGKRPASYLFISLLGAFLLMLALGMNGIIAAGGAVAVTFCAYNMQIIQVGHNAKMLALAYAPWVLAGVIFTYRSALRTKGKGWIWKTILGAALFAMALNFQIKANHVQITYYLAIIIFCYVLALFIWLMTSAEGRSLTGKFLAASAAMLVAGSLGIATNANRLIPTYIYTQETMRGGSELGGDNSKSKGLDLSYATAWSYGWEELPNMMIPDYNGGASAGAVNPDKSETIKLLKMAGQGNLKQVAKSLPLYWGPQPFTAGPMYMGAITIFLFLLGLGLCKGKDRWWMLAASIIGILLAVGNHFMAFTEFWYYLVPFYSKFRTVSMALVILQLTLPMLGFMALDRIVREQYDRAAFLKWGSIALAVTGLFCLFSMTGAGRSFTGAVDAGQPDILVDALIADRMSLLRHDALMSLILILLTYGLLLWSYSGKGELKSRKVIAGAAICVLVLINMFSVGKRYLNKDHFTTPRQFDGQFKERPVDKAILADEELDYRVLDLTVNVFNDSHPSYFHKNIGGYSPVKLQRYQDLIDRYLSSEINSIYRSVKGAATVSEVQASMPDIPILSMLNDKYIILDGNAAPLVNPGALGSVWQVKRAVRASTPDEEIELIGAVDLREEAVIGADFGDVLIPEVDSIAIRLSAYAPNELLYEYSAEGPAAVVFSEIYYPNGWTATLEDGTEVDIFRADWTLRGAVLPEGNHTLKMRFEPQSYKLSTHISRASSIALLLLLLLSLVPCLPLRRK